MDESILFTVSLLIIIVGILGTILPIFPGIFVVWAGVGLYAWQTDFTVIGIPLFLLITAVTLFGGLSDLWLPLFGANQSGASKRSYLLSAIGAIVGSFLLPVVGTIAGFVAGLFLGEYWKHQNTATAVQVSWGGLKGWGLATLLQMALGVLIFILFLWRVL